MEIKATLLYPFTFEEKRDFILLQNRQKGYEIQEQERIVEYQEKVLEFEEIDEEQKPIMVIDSETDEEYQKFHYETKEKTVIDLIALGYTEEEIEEQKKEQFHKDFFNTSLGWVRRKVSMQTGETKDFLADILPILQVGIPILTYTEEGEQNKVLVTEEFINECKQQVIKDFYGG